MRPCMVYSSCMHALLLAVTVLAVLLSTANADCEAGLTCGQFLPTGTRDFTCECYVWTVNPPPNTPCCRTPNGCSCEDDCAQYGDCCSDIDNCNVPSIFSLTPPNYDTGAGVTLTVSGDKLGTSNGKLKFNGNDLTIGTWSASSVTVSLPAGVGTNIPVAVETSEGKTSNTLTFNYNAPSIASLDPASGITSGSQIVIRGTSLGNSNLDIDWGGTSLPGGNVVSHTHTAITINTPVGTGTNKAVKVTVSGQTSNTATFSYLAPSISGATPSTGSTAGSDAIVLSGANFGAASVPLTVTLGGVSCTVTSHTHTAVNFDTPAGQGVGKEIKVTVDGQVSNSVTFNYDPPFISGMSSGNPSTAGGGELVVNGNNFGTSGAVSVGDRACDPITAYTQTQIKCQLPEGEGTGVPVRVTVSGIGSNTVGFIYAPPLINSDGVSPTSAKTDGTERMTITGVNFGLTGSVTVGGSTCTIESASDRTHTQIICRIPAGQGKNLNVVVSVQGRLATASQKFSYLPPTISGISPNPSPTAGNILFTVTGTNLGTSGTVTVGGLTANPTGTAFNHESVLVYLPAGQGESKPVIVTVGGQNAVFNYFSYSDPAITSVSPTSIPTEGGVDLTISGTSFGTSGATVSVIGSSAAVSVQTHSQIIVEAPARSTSSSGSVIVTIDGAQSSNSFPLSYAGPTVDSIFPETGPTTGGTTVTISGSSFEGDRGAGYVKLGGVELASYISWTHTEIVGTTAAGVGLDNTIEIKRKDDVVVSSTQVVFKFDAPTITGISPTSAGTTGTDYIVISGTNFGATQAAGSSTVTIGSLSCSLSGGSWAQGSISCRVPELSAGSSPSRLVKITVAGQISTDSVSFTYDPPTLTIVNPDSGETSGGTPIALTGGNLGSGAMWLADNGDAFITIGDIKCPIRSSPAPTHNQVYCTLPASGGGSGRNLAVKAHVGGQVSAVTSATLFNYFGPSITDINPRNGPTQGGTEIVITGNSFTTTTGTVVVGAASCTVTSWTDGEIRCNTPVGQGKLRPVKVQAAGATSNDDLTFSYDDPEIVSISPKSGPTAGGQLLIVTGKNFGESGNIRVNSKACSPVVSYSHLEVRCYTPAGSGKNQTVDAVVSSVVSERVNYYDYDPPSITRVSPDLAVSAGGITLTIYGSNLGQSGTVLIGGNKCEPAGNGFSDTSINCFLPAGEGKNRTVQVTIGGQSASTTAFSYARPLVSEVVPSSGPTSGATDITIKGSSFGITQSVSIDSQPCPITSSSHSQIVCTLPAGRGLNKHVQVTGGSQTSLETSLSLFNYDTPTITLVDPSTGVTDGWTATTPRLVTIYGASFDTTGTVKIGTTTCVQESYGQTQIVVRLPTGSGASQSVTILTATGLSNTDITFSYAPPLIVSLSPTQAATDGQQLVTLNGQNFGTSGVVNIGSASCLNPTTWTHSTIMCTIPAGQGEQIQVTVTVSSQVSNQKSFSYLPPAISYITPTEGATEGGITLEVNGANFGTSPEVTVGGKVCPLLPSGNTHKLLYCTLPSGQGSDKAVLVNAGGQLSGSGVEFDYKGPEIFSVSPSNGPTFGATPITIKGTSFGSSGSVTVGGASCLSTYYNSTYIVCSLPAGEGTSKELRVIVETVPSNVVFFNYDRPVISSVAPLNAPSEGGQIITVKGNNFGVSGYVQIGQRTCSPTGPVFNHSEIVCSLPAGGGSNNDVFVFVSSLKSDAFGTPFAYDKPSISVVAPSGGPSSGGTLITITGQSFGLSGSVAVGGVACPLAGTYSHTRLLCVVPEGQGVNQQVVVTSEGQSSTDAKFYTYDTPQITSVTPSIGPTSGGTRITLTGLNFGTVGSVYLDNRLCPAVDGGWTHTRVVCTQPPGIGINRAILVASTGQNSSAALFSFQPPSMVSYTTATPAYTEGNFVLSIHGSNFGDQPAAATVTVNSNPCSVQSAAHSVLTCLAPVGLGQFNLIAMIVGSQPATNTLSFAYAKPSITAVNGCTQVGNAATQCDISGGDSIVVAGNSFGAAGTGDLNITIGEKRLACGLVQYVTPHTSLSCVLPKNLEGGLSLPVYVTAGGQEGSSPLVSYKGPELIASTLNFVNTPASTPGRITANRDIDSLNPRKTNVLVTFSGRNLGANAGDISVTYFPASDPSKFMTCSDVQLVATSVPDTSNITCRLQDGGGVDLVFQVKVNLQTSPAGVDTLTYAPAPYLVNATLRLRNDSIKTTSLFGVSSEGDYIQFDGVWMGNDASLLTVTYGTPGAATYPYICSDVALYRLLSGEEVVTCKTEAGDGGPYAFNVSVANQPSRLNGAPDTYSYPDAPTINSVSGCNDSGNSTFDCPTKGGISITIHGEKISANNATTSVKIGVQSCPITQFIGSTQIVCTLPAGTGFDQTVVVVVGSLFSRGKKLLNYARPSIDTITGDSPCETDGSSVKNCPRGGAVNIVLTGRNFGSSGAIVVVGGSPCTSPAHTVSQPHEQVTCTIPQGITESTTVLLIQGGGEITDNVGLKTISYRQCEAGTRDNGSLACDPCQPGYFSASPGQPVCSPCDAGKFADSARATTCLPCSQGSFSVRTTAGDAVIGPSTCNNCSAGTFASSTGLSACTKCAVGEFNNVDKASGCQACAVGRFGDTEGATVCQNCAKGFVATSTSSLACSPCQPGYFANDTGLSRCFSCPAGRAQPNTQGDGCVPCAAGSSIAAVAQSACFQCDAGYVSNVTGLTACSKCSAGSFSLKTGDQGTGFFGPTFCQLCPPGKANPSEGQSSCLTCTEGRFTDAAGSTSCTKCAAGFAQGESGKSFCTACQPGQWAATSGASKCDACSSGRYAPSTNMSTCLLCEPGRFMALTSSSFCDSCVTGKFVSTSGAVECKSCEDGTFANVTGTSTCAVCPPGTFSEYDVNNGPSTCTKCDAGKFSDSSRSSNCQTCPSGEVSGTPGSSSCTLCVAGTYADKASGATRCLNCTSGRYSDSPRSLDCIDCLSGKVAPQERSTQCVPCATGRFRDAPPAVTCKACAAGYAGKSTGLVECDICKKGEFSNSTGSSVCTKCLPGTATNNQGSTVCGQCDPGKFIAAEGSLTCDDCPKGKYQPASGATTCELCPLGKAAGSPGNPTCGDCSEGTYADTKGQIQCKSAPAGRFVPSTGQNASTPCPAGYRQHLTGQSGCFACAVGRFIDSVGYESNLCVDCETGTYAASTNSSACTKCEVGKFSSSPGAVACQFCPNGTISVSVGTVECAKCVSGRYSQIQGGTICLRCAEGFYQPSSGRSSCLPCKAGQFSSTKGAQGCESCASGTFANVSASTQCQTCSAGTFSEKQVGDTGPTICKECTTGRAVSVPGQQSCIKCEAGKYTSVTGQSACEQCDRGYFQSITGQTTCLPCALGKVASNPGAASCDSCRPGEAAPFPNMTSCLVCDKGYIAASTGSTACEICAAGYFSPSSGATVCTACSAGQYAPTNGSSECTSCKAGSYQDSIAQTTCISCARGKATEGTLATVCADCNVGRFTNSTGSLTCTKCPKGKAAKSAGSPLCVDCLPGTFSNEEGAAQCTRCSAGKYSTAPHILSNNNGTFESVCLSCPPGSAQSQTGQANCLACQNGTYSSGFGWVACKPCAAGKYETSTNSTECSSCEAGKFSSNDVTKCTPCAPGRFTSTAAQGLCSPCSAGSFNNYTGATGCQPCPRGYFQDAQGRTLCEPCIAGRFQAATGRETCDSCPKGRFATANATTDCLYCSTGTIAPSERSTTCFVCENGTVNGFIGMSACQVCPAGQFANVSDPVQAAAGLTSCTKCVAGRYISESQQTSCKACIPGKYAGNPGAIKCDRCAPGTFGNGTALSACEKCPTGRFSNPRSDLPIGALLCDDCTVGKFAALTGQAVCESCPTGQFQNESRSTTCKLCPIGTFNPVFTQTECTNCSVGRYNAFIGQDECKLCEEGRYTNVTKATDCLNCPSGRFQQQAGQTGCSDCTEGKFQIGEGQAQCSLCPVGEFGNLTRQTGCNPCLPGTHAAGEGSTVCSQCAAGRFSLSTRTVICDPCETGSFGNLTGQTTCQRCPIGTQQSVIGKTECDKCEVGTFSNALGTVQCKPCPTGQAVNVNGSTQCFDCTQGRFASSEKTAVCSPCPVGTFANGNGFSICDDCPTGKFQNATGNSFCYDCPIGKNANATGLSSCFRCNPGSYTNVVGRESCFPCSAGEEQPASGATQCVQCLKGKFQDVEGQPTCLDCPGGFFSPGNGAAECQPCLAGRRGPFDRPDKSDCLACEIGTSDGTVGLNQTHCPPCALGRFTASVSQKQCTACPKGTYTNVTLSNGEWQGATECVDCSPGTFADSTQSQNCTRCPAGRYQPDKGQQQCKPCEVGRYTDVAGQTVCQDCSLGKYAPTPDLAQCLECPRGSYSVANGTSECSQCEVGRFQNTTGQTACTPCDVGSHASSPGTRVCAPCELGRYALVTNSKDCLACEPGRFSNQTGLSDTCFRCPIKTHASSEASSACTECGAGTYANLEGLAQCFACPIGKIQTLNGTSACVDCDVGRFQGAVGKTECAPCTAGRFSDATGAFLCTQCREGTYQNDTGHTACRQCEIGKATRAKGRTACADCEPGFYVGTTGNSICLECNDGFFSDEFGASSCSLCGAGKYTSDASKSFCQDCTPGTSSSNTSAAHGSCPECTDRFVALFPGQDRCTICDRLATPNTYHDLCECHVGYFAKNTNNTQDLCVECPDGALCKEIGVTYANIQTRSGWWRASCGSFQWFRCLYEFQCPGGIGCSEQLCADNHHGPLCALCDEGFYVDTRGQCVVCPESGTAWFSFLIISVVVVLALWLQFWVLLKSGEELMREAKHIDDRHREGFDEFDEFGMNKDANAIRSYYTHEPPPPPPNLVYKLKICVGFIQIMTNLAFSVDIPWPSAYKEFISWFNVINMDFVKLSSVECVAPMNYFDRFAIFSLVPIALGLTVFCVYLLPKYYGSCYRDDSADMRKRSRQRFWRIFTFALFIIYPTVSSTVIRLYVCKDIQGEKYLLSDLSISCDSQQWRDWAILGSIMVLIYPVGIPAFFGYMLYKNRRNLANPGIRAQLGVLYDGYHHPQWWFELIDMGHKLFQVAMIAFFPEDLQLPFAMTAVGLYQITLLFNNPYIRKGDDRLHLLANTEIFLLLLAVHVFSAQLKTDDVLDIILSLILISFALIFFGYFIPQITRVLLKMCVRKSSRFGRCMRWHPRVREWLGETERKRKDGIVSDEMVTELKAQETSGTDGRVIATVGKIKRRTSENELHDVRLQRNPIFMEVANTGDITNLGGMGNVVMSANPLRDDYAQKAAEPVYETANIEDLQVTETLEVVIPEPDRPKAQPLAFEKAAAPAKYREEFAPRRPKQKKGSVAESTSRVNRSQNK